MSLGKKHTHVRWKYNILKTGMKYNTNAMPVSNLLFEHYVQKKFLLSIMKLLFYNGNNFQWKKHSRIINKV